MQHNIKFRPREGHPDFDRKQDSNHSDIDVLGYNPNLDDPMRVYAVSCKSWQSGFNPESYLNKIRDKKKVGGREAWKSVRELCCPKWSEAFIQAVKDATGTDRFTHVVAVTKLTGEKSVWIENKSFNENIGGNPLDVLTAKEVLDHIINDHIKQLGTTLASTQVGRLIQIIRASEYDFRA